jgi:hypothetical protein
MRSFSDNISLLAFMAAFVCWGLPLISWLRSLFCRLSCFRRIWLFDFRFGYLNFAYFLHEGPAWV